MADDALRRLERLVQEAPDDPRAWAALATQLVRLGRQEDAARAAWRAARLDPRSPARELIPGPTSELVSAVPWGGARPGAGRELAQAPPPRLWAQVVDLGGGRVAYDAPGALAAVDLITGERVWSRPVDRWWHRVRWGFDLPLLGWGGDARVLEEVDPATGETVAGRRFDGAPEEASVLGSPDVVVFVEHGPMRHDSRATTPRLFTFDLRSGAPLGRFEAPPTRRTPRIDVTRERVVVSCLEPEGADRPGVNAYDLTGRVAWRAPEPTALGVDARRVLVTDPGGGSRALDLATGRELALFPHLVGSVLCATPRELVVGDEHQAAVLDRQTLEPLWSTVEDLSFVVGTREALLWIRPGATGSVLVSHDARTAAPLAELELPGAAHASLGLVAQHLVLALRLRDGEPAGPVRVLELLPL